MHVTANTLVGHFGARCDLISFSCTPLNCSSSSSLPSSLSASLLRPKSLSLDSPDARSTLNNYSVYASVGNDELGEGLHTSSSRQDVPDQLEPVCEVSTCQALQHTSQCVSDIL